MQGSGVNEDVRQAKEVIKMKAASNTPKKPYQRPKVKSERDRGELAH